MRFRPKAHLKTMYHSVLPIFPDGSAASTVTTTVWVGVLVSVWANTRLGWTLSGLVVPGYLVPLMMIRPVSVGVILVEAVITYGIVYAISETGTRSVYWSSFFGRDRFFALVLVSVLVRVGCDGYLLPFLGRTASSLLGFHLNFEDQLHSVGLVIVALIANYFWKPGLCRGVGPLTATVVVTYLVVRYLLIPYTSFDIANLRYVYEDIASSLLASPKAYMILITTAYLASRMNLRYAWEYNGMLIPALAALHWCEPLKLVSSLVEAVVILLVAGLVLKIPRLRGANIQGSQKIALFFTVAFIYRLSIAWMTHWLAPDWKTTDLYAFGYLLSTLLANRFHQHGHALRISVAALKVSLVGAVAGSFIGYALMRAPDPWQSSAFGEFPAGRPIADNATLIRAVRDDKLNLYERQARRTSHMTVAADISRVRRAIHQMLHSVHDHPTAVDTANVQLAPVGLEVHLLEHRYAYLREKEPFGGCGLFVFDLEQKDRLFISVPHPLREPYSLEAGLCLFRHLEASVLAVAGFTAPTTGTTGASSADRSLTLFHALHESFGKRRTLQLRAHTEDSASQFATGRTAPEIFDHGDSLLWVTGGLPRGYNLQTLTNLVGQLSVRWEDPLRENAVRRIAAPGFAELYLSRRVRTSLFSRLVVSSSATNDQPIAVKTGRLVTWLLDQKQHIARAGTEAYVPARQEELIMLDQEVLQPMMQMLRGSETSADQRRRRIELLNASAAALNYVVTPFSDPHRNARYLVLHEREPRRRHWGTYVFAEDHDAPFVWEVPRPILELNALEFGVQAFSRSGAAALLIAGAHLHANLDGSADVARFSNKFTLFNLVHQALLRERNGTPTLVVQSRAIKDPVSVDVVMATDDGASRRDQLSPLKAQLVRQIARDDLKVGFVDGSSEFAGYELGSTPQWEAIKHSVAIEFVSAWLSASLRWQYRQQTENDLLQSHLLALGIPSIETDLVGYLVDLARRPETAAERAEYASDDEDVFPTALRDLLSNYLRRRDIVLLEQLQTTPGVHLEHVLDVATQQAFLLLRQGNDPWPLVVNLADMRDGSPTTHEIDQVESRQITRFIESRATWLVWKRGAP